MAQAHRHARTQTPRVTLAAMAACAVAATVAVGCAAAGSGSPAIFSGSPAVVVRDQSNGHTVSVKVGDRLELVLASDYWTVRGSSLPRVLRQDGPTSDLPTPPGCGHIPGLGCVPIRTDFSALAAGTAVITASRTSCGEAMGCAPGQRHFTVTVVVRQR